MIQQQQSVMPSPDGDYLDELITEKQAAAFLNYTDRALQNWRYRGDGPDFVRVSKRSIRYRRRELIVWSEERLRTSTSDIRLSDVI